VAWNRRRGADGTPPGRPSFPGREDRPVVLLTLGTVINDADLLTKLISSLGEVDVNVVVTHGTEFDAAAIDRSRVHPVGFTPLAQLLDYADVVVSAAGSGTLLATLASGLPSVLLPLGAPKSPGTPLRRPLLA
jgi:UDP:flavonoid glycosyltransferase YjiC (YdhE family)